MTDTGEPTDAPRPDFLPEYMMTLINSCYIISDELLPELVAKVRKRHTLAIRRVLLFHLATTDNVLG